MARLEAKARGLYYPTLQPNLEDLVQYLRVADQTSFVRLLDPCCGEGTALCYIRDCLAQAYPDVQFETWGVEISEERAALAAEQLDQVICAPFEVTASSFANRGVSFVLLNPPYDDDGEGGRLETMFLTQSFRWGGKGTVYAIIVPHTALTWGFLAQLELHLEEIRFYRYPDRDDRSGYAAFKQVVVLGTRREKTGYYPYGRVTDMQTKACAGRWDTGNQLTTQLPDGIRYTIPASTRDTSMRRADYTLAELGVACEQDGLYQALADAAYPPIPEVQEPLLPPNDGHIAMLVCGGMLGTLEHQGRAFKGSVVKTQVPIESDNLDTTKTVDRYETHFCCIEKDEFRHMTDKKQIAAFLEDQIDVFRDYVAEHFQAYGADMTPEEEAILNTLSRDKVLPGLDLGLAPDQKAKTVAMKRSIERYGVGHLVAEMGYGKTRCAGAVAEIMDAYPALVICPPHLPDQWVEELEASVPGVRAVVVTRLEDTMTEDGKITETGLATVIRESKRGRLPEKLVVVIPTSMAKLGPGWEPQVNWTRVDPGRTDIREGRSYRKREYPELLEHYRELRLQYVAARQHGARAEDLQRLREAVRAARKSTLRAVSFQPTCPACGEELIGIEKFGHLKQIQKQPQCCPECKSALWQHAPTISRRWPLADYIAAQAPRFFKLLIADEVHKAKAKDTGIGRAFQILCRTIPTLTLTGTFFGGRSSSLFYLLYRTQKNVRDVFAFHGETAWVQRFGVYETTYKTDDSYSAGTAKKQHKTSSKERPGISPEIASFILPTTAFGRVVELGAQLPPYQEDIVHLELGHIDKHIERFEAWAWSTMINWWPIWTSSWLQWTLARPNSAFRTETVTYPALVMRVDEETGLPCFNEMTGTVETEQGKATLDLPAMIDDEHPYLQKEEWLADTIKAERAAGRRVVIYVRQTSTRDIQERVKQVLADVGVKAVILRSGSPPTRKRRAWLKRNSKAVLICNPRLVETGMNLHDYGYCTIIFYEIEYSLYTLWQAMSRVWRPGQTKNVKVFFSIYAETMEEKAMSLIIDKMMSAKLLYGQEVTGALVSDTGESSLVMELANALRAGRKLDIEDKDQVFGTRGDELVSTSPMPQPTKRSRDIPTFRDWLKEQGITSLEEMREIAHSGRRTKKVEVPEAQIVLF